MSRETLHSLTCPYCFESTTLEDFLSSHCVRVHRLDPRTTCCCCGGRRRWTAEAAPLHGEHRRRCQSALLKDSSRLEGGKDVGHTLYDARRRDFVAFRRAKMHPPRIVENAAWKRIGFYDDVLPPPDDWKDLRDETLRRMLVRLMKKGTAFYGVLVEAPAFEGFRARASQFFDVVPKWSVCDDRRAVPHRHLLLATECPERSEPMLWNAWGVEWTRIRDNFHLTCWMDSTREARIDCDGRDPDTCLGVEKRSVVADSAVKRAERAVGRDGL